MYRQLPDAVADALGQVVAGVRKDFARDLECHVAAQRAQMAELQLAGETRLRAIEDRAVTIFARIEEKLATVRDGEPGPVGADGRDGKDFDPQVLEATVVAHVAKAVAELPPAKDGERGERGEPGKDADPALVETLVAEKIAPLFTQAESWVERAVEDRIALVPPPKDGEPGPRGEIGQPGADGCGIADLQLRDGCLIIRMTDEREVSLGHIVGIDGKDGAPGQDADPELVAKLVAEHVEKAVARLPPAKDGIDGKDGHDGVDGLPGPEGPKGEAGPAGEKGETGEVGPQGPEGPQGEAGLIGPPGEKGEAGERGETGEKGEPGLDGARGDAGDPGPQGLQGEKGEPGDRGTRGEKGEPGRDGASLAGALIDRNGALILTLSDGTVRELGPIVGKDGAPGEPGQPGKDGLDGVNFDDMEIIEAGDRAFIIRCVRGEKIKEWTLRKPGFIDRGVYKAGATYDAGDAVSFGGSLWLAQRETADKPGDGENSGWRLAVKTGRAGKDGRDGERGERGPEGPRGKDWTIAGPQ